VTKDFLRSVLIQESRAYGFTLAFWGSGALLIQHFGAPSLEQVLAYVGGALIGFGAITLAAFRQAFTTAEAEEPEYLVFSMIHFLSALGPIAVTFFSIPLGSPGAFLVAGFSVSTVYNLLMMVEERLSRRALELERRLLDL
jgi:hypothetical protein